MRMTILGAAVAALVAVPLAAHQGSQGGNRQATGPRTSAGEMILYKDTNYNGEDYMIDGPRSMVRTDWNIRSLTIHPGDRWQICARPRFRDPCIVLDRSVHDASLIGVEGQIGSARPAPETPPPS